MPRLTKPRIGTGKQHENTCTRLIFKLGCPPLLPEIREDVIQFSIMAVSPLMTQSETASTKITAVKAKSLAVRTSLSGQGGKKPTAARERGPELAERLNDETRQKYIKGVSSVDFAYTLRCLTLFR